MEQELETTALDVEEEEYDEVLLDELYVISNIVLRLLILLAGTVLFSVVYKGMIEVGLFQLVHGKAAHNFVYCVFELLLLGGFWHCVFIFSKKCRHRSQSRTAFFLITGFVAAAYAVICCLLYHFLSRELYSWLMRITLNLCGLRFRSSFPHHLAPYLIAFLVITILILLLEPAIAKRRYKRFLRMRKGLDSPLQERLKERRERIEKERFKRYRHRMHKKHKKMRERSKKLEEREEIREERWEMRQKKLRQRKRKRMREKEERKNHKS